MRDGDQSYNKKAVPSKDVVKEPEISYSVEPTSKKLTISSLASQEQDNYLYWLSLTPSQRIANVTVLIRKVYADQLNQPGNTEHIIFDKQ
jgi:hypothetical protein